MDREPLLGPDEHGIRRDADIAPVRTADRRFADGDHDVFGDGTLVLLAREHSAEIRVSHDPRHRADFGAPGDVVLR
ncbi:MULTISPECIES: hypothetical protein [unclassified Pseudonocardia]|uniref:hypothetical protein n=1 Tax=unclassified Pseudonocardia TaxID=2619320 RepID=UPI0001FFF3BD|nr:MULTISPECIES: hypothetical protein [unclassified Pseudonocardia]ALE75065.1 hypothetical protein FRP1_22945 [Pseudonocardia sp. EC080625-04]ALL74417.1 hypothetical protein AD006_02130 [Pseudonocardia sp. EC080610-09]ALL81439.1 hypothetical protein AD017_09955 [Pseudonocardia sp. EC080619-01]OLM16359.1 hypothetical protein Ae707Ps1_0617 [Pseudonocardia sp. Ae707_Ps1]